MQTQTALEPKSRPAPDIPFMVEAKKLLDRVQEQFAVRVTQKEEMEWLP